ncbi:ArsR/SmtB family transcription factor [Saccharospirillum alexandrii]|uniref:ArsR/SmtB family transcription factor n=1 Tax=Saccharospirillum alexandrii TaxID=2448477 RepID=UPI0016BF01C6
MMTDQIAPSQTLNDDQLDLVFKALSDRTRRKLLAELARGDASVSELAAPLHMSLPAASKHIRVLENASLVKRTKSGRVQYCALQAEALADADAWLNHYRAYWNDQLDTLQHFLESDPS